MFATVFPRGVSLSTRSEFFCCSGDERSFVILGEWQRYIV
jgi:hypothetical protein